MLDLEDITTKNVGSGCSRGRMGTDSMAVGNRQTKITIHMLYTNKKKQKLHLKLTESMNTK
jgi:hypothetical protein